MSRLDEHVSGDACFCLDGERQKELEKDMPDN